MKMTPEEKFINQAKKYFSFELNQDFLRKKLVSPYFEIHISQLGSEVDLVKACVWLYKEKNIPISSQALNGLIKRIEANKENQENISQEDIIYLASTPLQIHQVGIPKVHQGALNQLKLIKKIEDKAIQKEISLKIYKTLLDTQDSLAVQQKIAKHWAKLGQFEEIEHLVPALSPNTKAIENTSTKLIITKIDCKKLSKGFDKITQQRSIMSHIEQMIQGFEIVEMDSGIVHKEIKPNNQTVSVWFKEDGKHEEFKFFLETMTQDLSKIVEKPPIESLKQSKAMYPKIILAKKLSNSLENKSVKIQRLKL